MPPMTRAKRTRIAMTNPRKTSNGYLIRVNAGTDLSSFGNITLHVSASVNQGWSLNLVASTLFVGNSTIFSSTEGLTFNSGEWAYGTQTSAFATASDYDFHLVCSATSQAFITPIFTITVDE